MYEESVAPELACSYRGLKHGMVLDLYDPKKVPRDVLTNKDLGMLELTSPELERIILDPNDESFHQQLPGHSAKTTQQSDIGRSFYSHLDQLQQQPNLPEPALAAAASFDEESDSDPSPFTYTTLFPPKATNETGFPSESFSDMKPKSVSVRSSNSTASSVGDESWTSRMDTVLPTAVHPGVSYLPFGAFYSVPSCLKEEPMQLVPSLDRNPVPSFPPMSPMKLGDQDRIRQERKRERNRLAARKCRTKKLEQIMHLEERVKELKEQNRALGDAATALRAQMNKLQSQFSQHISCGCPMMMSTTTAAAAMMKHSSS